MTYEKERDEAARKKAEESCDSVGCGMEAFNAGADWHHKRCQDVLGRVAEHMCNARSEATHKSTNISGEYIVDELCQALTLLEGIGGEE